MVSEAVWQTLGLDEAVVRRAEALHAESLVIDCSAVVKQEDAHFERFRAGGVTAVNHTVTAPDIGLAEALTAVDECRHWIRNHPAHLILTSAADAILTAKESNREAVILGPQDTLMIGRNLRLLSVFYDLGVRILQLTYQKRNWIGDGCGEPDAGGLSRFGVEAVREMNDLGILIDLSHCSEPTSYDAIRHSTKPLIFSHAHANRVTPHIRAKSDDLIKALADTGGVIGVTALSPFTRLEKGVRPGLKEFAYHVDYLVNLVGEDHVGIGLDFDETNTPEKHAADLARNPELALTQEFGWDERRVEHLTNAADVGNVTLSLMGLGYSEETIRKILGLNFLRVFKEAWHS